MKKETLGQQQQQQQRDESRKLQSPNLSDEHAIKRLRTSSNTMAVSKQVAVQVQVQAAASISIDGSYEEIGEGYCQPMNGKFYPEIKISSATADLCPALCGCTQVEGANYRGFSWEDFYKACFCYVDWLNPNDAEDKAVIDNLNAQCDPAVYNTGADGSWTGSGEITGTDGESDVICYALTLTQTPSQSPSTSTLSKSGKAPKRE